MYQISENEPAVNPAPAIPLDRPHFIGDEEEYDGDCDWDAPDPTPAGADEVLGAEYEEFLDGLRWTLAEREQGLEYDGPTPF